MDFYLDECLSKKVAHSLDVFDDNNRIFSVKELFEGKPDDELIGELNKCNADVLITQDIAFVKRIYQYKGYKANNISVMIVKIAQGAEENIQWISLVQKWALITKLSRKLSKPFICRLLKSKDPKTNKPYHLY